MRDSQKQLLKKGIISMGLDEYVGEGVKIAIAGWFDLECHCEDGKGELAVKVPESG
jgi:hypothetical protein